MGHTWVNPPSLGDGGAVRGIHGEGAVPRGSSLTAGARALQDGGGRPGPGAEVWRSGT